MAHLSSNITISKEEQGDEYVRNYLKEKRLALAEIHETWGLDESEPEDLGDQSEQLRHFTEVLEMYCSWSRTNDRPFDPLSCTWSDVLEQLQMAYEAAAKAELADTTLWRRSQRRLANISKYLEPGLDGIPDLLAPLHGGLGLVFHLLQTRETNRQDILAAFEDIPGIVQMAYIQSMKFPNHPILHQHLNHFKSNLCHAIPRLVDILIPENFWAKTKNRFRGHKVADLLHLIRGSARKVESCAVELHNDLVAKNTGLIHATATRTLEYVEGIRDEMTKVDRNMTSLNGNYDKIGDRMLALEEAVSKQLDYASTRNQIGLKEMLKGVVAAFQYFSENSMPSIAQATSTASVFHVASPEQRDNFLHILNALHKEAEDLSMVIRQDRGREYDASSKSYYAMILGTRRFHAWLYMAHSDLIYIEGPFGTSTVSARQSPLSYFCANLVGQFEGSEDTVTLHFFCGQHSASHGHFQGPRALLRSLLTQILQNWSNPPWEVVNIPQNFDGTHQAIPTEELCRRLELAVARVPATTTILCIIDSLPSFEKTCWEEDYWLVLSTLGNLVYTQEPNVKFKVLMTSSIRSRVLQEQFTKENRIEVTQRGQVTGRERQETLWNDVRSRVGDRVKD